MSNIDRCYYRTSTFDPETSLPLYVLDTTFLPSSLFNSIDLDSQPKLQEFVNNIIDKIPTENHGLVLFTNGFYKSSNSIINDKNNKNNNTNSTSNNNSISDLKLPINIIKILKLIPTDKKKFLIKIYIVHSTWLLKSIVELFNKFYSLNSSSHPTIINCDNLTTLSHYIDITKIPISLHTYLIDKIQYKNNKIILNRHLIPIYGRPLTIYSLHNSLLSSNNNLLPLNQFARIFNNLIAYLSNKNLDIQLSSNDWLTIIRCSALSNETKISIDILSDCLKRDQLIVLSDYSFLEHYMIIVKFILKLSNSKNPLIPLEILISFNNSNKNEIDFNDINQVNNILNKVLIFRHPLIDLNYSSLSSSKISSDSKSNQLNENEIDSYDNSYILIKIFKLFRFLLSKLERESSILEPNAKNQSKAIERQSLKLILAFTKILYSDNFESTTQEEDDIGFDNLFKLLRSIMQFFDNLTILGTVYTLDDFNNHISFDDFLAFENFKNKQLGVQDVLESKIITTNNKKNNLQNTSPVKPKNNLNPNLNSNSDSIPLPPSPRKNHLLSVKKKESDSRSVSISSKDSNNSVDSNNSLMETNADTTIPVTKSEIDMLANSTESLGLDDTDDITTTTTNIATNYNNNDNKIINNDYDPNNIFQTPKRTNTSNDLSDTETINDMVSDLLTPTRPLNSMPSISSISDNLLTPSPRKQPIQRPTTIKPAFLDNLLPTKNTNLRKYTEKDLEVQQKAEKLKQAAILKEQHAKEVEQGVRRGERKVSRLARLYEEKHMNEK